MAGCLPLSLETGGNMGQCARVETGRAGRPDDIPQSPVLGLLWVYLGHWKLWGGGAPPGNSLWFSAPQRNRRATP